jgi:hypothetical protein
MYKLLGIEEILGNVIKLAKPFLNAVPNKYILQTAYRQFLLEAQPKVPKPENIDLCFLSTKDEVSLLLEVFKEESILDDFNEVFDSNSSQSNKSILGVQEALKKMREINPSYSQLIDLAIHTIFSSPSKLAGGGSTSAAIGCIWVNLRKHWQEQDVLEFLVHETTHNLVFIDELCHTHYINYLEISKPENFAHSAILSKPRPLDKVFHSIIVSVEVLSFRQDQLGHPDQPCLHPPSDILLDQTNRSLVSVLENEAIKRLLTERAVSILKKCREKLQNIESNVICAM